MVDDEPDLRLLLQIALTDAGHEVASVASGEDAIAALSGASFELVLTDLKLLGMSGLELLERVRRDWPEISVIVITGFATDDGILRCLEAGAHSALRKPFDLDDLLARASDAIRQHREAKPRLRLPER